MVPSAFTDRLDQTRAAPLRPPLHSSARRRAGRGLTDSGPRWQLVVRLLAASSLGLCRSRSAATIDCASRSRRPPASTRPPRDPRGSATIRLRSHPGTLRSRRAWPHRCRRRGTPPPGLGDRPMRHRPRSSASGPEAVPDRPSMSRAAWVAAPDDERGLETIGGLPEPAAAGEHRQAPALRGHDVARKRRVACHPRPASQPVGEGRPRPPRRRRHRRRRREPPTDRAPRAGPGDLLGPVSMASARRSNAARSGRLPCPVRDAVAALAPAGDAVVAAPRRPFDDRRERERRSPSGGPRPPGSPRRSRDRPPPRRRARNRSRNGWWWPYSSPSVAISANGVARRRRHRSRPAAGTTRSRANRSASGSRRARTRPTSRARRRRRRRRSSARRRARPGTAGVCRGRAPASCQGARIVWVNPASASSRSVSRSTAVSGSQTPVGRRPNRQLEVAQAPADLGPPVRGASRAAGSCDGRAGPCPCTPASPVDEAAIGDRVAILQPAGERRSEVPRDPPEVAELGVGPVAVGGDPAVPVVGRRGRRVRRDQPGRRDRSATAGRSGRGRRGGAGSCLDAPRSRSARHGVRRRRPTNARHPAPGRSATTAAARCPGRRARSRLLGVGDGLDRGPPRLGRDRDGGGDRDPDVVVALGEPLHRLCDAARIVRRARAADLPPRRRVAAAAQHRRRPFDAEARVDRASSPCCPARSSVRGSGRSRSPPTRRSLGHPDRGGGIAGRDPRLAAHDEAAGVELADVVGAVERIAELRAGGVRPLVRRRVAGQETDQATPPLVGVVERTARRARAPSPARRRGSMPGAPSASSPDAGGESGLVSAEHLVVRLGPATQHGRHRVADRPDVPARRSRRRRRGRR